MENNSSAQSVAEIWQQEEAKRVAVAAGRATIGNTWIAFATLVMGLAVIICGGIFGYAQLIDQVKGNAEETKELKGDVRALSVTVNLMAGRMGVQPQAGSNSVAVASQLPGNAPRASNFLTIQPRQAAQCDLLQFCHLPQRSEALSPYQTRLHW